MGGDRRWEGGEGGGRTMWIIRFFVVEFRHFLVLFFTTEIDI